MALHLLAGSGVWGHAALCGLALLLTYCIHGGLWTAAAWAIARARLLSSSTQHLLWRLALLGPLATTLLAAAWPWNAAPAPRLSVSAPQTAFSLMGAVGAGHTVTWPVLLGLACGVAAALGLLRFVLSLLLLHRSLAGRRPVTDARLLRRLAGLRASIGPARVTLTESARIASPLVIGMSEICVPVGRLSALSEPQLDTVFAHELAHLERRDGVWFPVAGLLQSMLWMQPLNHFVASRFRKSAELACDDRAVELTDDPLGLASALTEVAAGAMFNRRRLVVPTMAHGKHALLERVRRLVDTHGSRARDRLSMRRGAALLLTALGVVAVGFSVRVAAAPPGGAPPVAPDAAAESKKLDGLLLREQQLVEQLADAQRAAGAERAGTPATVRVIELQQDLHHVRAAEVWIESRFVEAARAWDQHR